VPTAGPREWIPLEGTHRVTTLPSPCTTDQPGVAAALCPGRRAASPPASSADSRAGREFFEGLACSCALWRGWRL
jgi:hypothetical protein